jgi:hypothetical protein
MVNTKRKEHVLTYNVGHSQDYFYSTQRTAISAKNIALQNILHYPRVHLHFPMLCIWSFDGNSVVHSWHPSPVNGPVATFNDIHFFEKLLMNHICEIWFPNREQKKVFKAIFVLCLYATHSFIFVNNAKLVHRRQPYPVCWIKFFRKFCLLWHIVKKHFRSGQVPDDSTAHAHCMPDN